MWELQPTFNFFLTLQLHVHINKYASASGGLRLPDPHRGSAPGPRWGISVPQTSWLAPPFINSCIRHCIMNTFIRHKYGNQHNQHSTSHNENKIIEEKKKLKIKKITSYYSSPRPGLSSLSSTPYLVSPWLTGQSSCPSAPPY